MKTQRLAMTAVLTFAIATRVAAQDATGFVAMDVCRDVNPDNLAAGGELYTVKIHNPGRGPDFHEDWLFDVRSKGGAQIPGVDVGGSMYSINGNWKQNLVPPENMFVIITYPDGHVAMDSSLVRNGAALGAVNMYRLGDSLPVGVASGIGLSLPVGASSYEVSNLADHADGTPATFPFGTHRAIEVAFAPIAEVNNSEIASGCTIGSEFEDPQARFGMIVGYNVYRIAGLPGVIPQPADFVGQWQYYMPFDGFDLNTPDTLGQAGADLNGDGLPDGDGSDAPTDSNPDNDLVGFQNPNGIPYDGDEVLIYQDSWLNPDHTPRSYGTGPDMSGNTGYWYAFQPVLYSGTSDISAFDGLGFTRDDLFVGQHTMDLDGNGIADAVDFDQDGSPEFYSPQAEHGIQGFGLTHGGLPLLSPPVYGRANPAVASGGMSLTGRPNPIGMDLTLRVAFERADTLGYNVFRLGPAPNQVTRINSSLILASGGEGSSYSLTDRVSLRGRRVAGGVMTYQVETIHSDGEPSTISSPYTVGLASSRTRRR